MKRAILLVLDSFGIGGAEDAAHYGDEGADTFGHIAEACGGGRGDRPSVRFGPLRLPNLGALGLAFAATASTGKPRVDLGNGDAPPSAAWGYGIETARGKDTPSGHWEIAGVPLMHDWTYFPDTHPSFPRALTDALVREARLPGILGDKHAPGTAMVDELGEEHIRTGKPICYTSADSVFQIAAHETYFGLERLYETCLIARRLCDPLNVGRVIARPFIGETRDTFKRTAHRRDYALPPPGLTLCDRVVASGHRVVGVGKIGDIFAHRGISENLKGPDDSALFDLTIEALAGLGDGDLLFANYVDFDTLYGHRRDVAGYAAALEAFDGRLPELMRRLQPGDLAIITADHGNDPTFPGTDHTREHVPILAFGPGIAGGAIGGRKTLADIGETIASHLGMRPGPHGHTFLPVSSSGEG